VVAPVDFVSEAFSQPTAARPGVIEPLERRLVVADQALLPDDGADPRLDPLQIRICLCRRIFLQSTDHGDHVIARSVAKLACDEETVGIPWPGSLKRLGADIPQAVTKIRRDPVGSVGGDLPEHRNDLHE
jgi:hypothetical protein